MNYQLSTNDMRAMKPTRHEFAQMVRLPIRVILNGVHNKANIGSIFRLCDAMMVEHLTIGEFGFEAHKRRVVTAATGTIKWVQWSMQPSVEAIVQAKADGYQVVAVEITSDSIPLEDFQPSKPVCLIFGSETYGISQEILDMVDLSVMLPMNGIGNSINVASTVGIALYQTSTWLRKIRK